MDAITAEGLVKIYRSRKSEVRALDGLDLTVDGGDRARPPRAERRRQDDDRPHPRDAPPARRRACHGGGLRRRQAGRPAALGDRAVGPVRRGRREPDRAREPVHVRPSLPAADRRVEAARDRAARAVQPVGRGRSDGQDLFGRDAPSARPGQRSDRATAPPLPRRADDRSRPAQPARDVGGHPRPGPRRHDAPAHHPVPRGGRRVGRHDRGRRRRTDHRPRHGRRAQDPGRRRAHRGRRPLARGHRPRHRAACARTRTATPPSTSTPGS